MLLLFGFGNAIAQRVITGKVIDADGLPVLGATVGIKGTTAGTISGEDGTYRLKVPANVTGDTIVISFMGMRTFEEPINGRTVIDANLQSDDVAVDEVVVTAMGISKQRKAIGYSTVQVSAEEITEGKTSNPVAALAGKVAGVEISGNSGPGSSQNIMIRGAASFSGNQPLIVVDGVPMINAQSSYGTGLFERADLGTGLNAVNPNDIESMTVLKGAAATALYGSRAANGVILITTKNGKNSEGKVNITYDGLVSISRVGYLPKLQSEFGQGFYNTISHQENGDWGPKYTGNTIHWGYPYNGEMRTREFSFVEDHLRDYYELGIGNNHSLSLSGGNDNTTYYFSVSNDKEDGVVPGEHDTYNRTTISTRGSQKWGKLSIRTSMNFDNERTNAMPGGIYTSSMAQAASVPNSISFADLKDLDNVYNTLDYYFTQYNLNPYWVLENQNVEFRKNKFYGKFQLDFEIIKGLKITERFGGDIENRRRTYSIGTVSFTPSLPTANNGAYQAADGSYGNNRSNQYEINNDVMISYSKQFGENWNLSALAGFNLMESKVSSVAGNITTIDVDGFFNFTNSFADAIASESSSKLRRLGVFGNVDLDWKRMVYLTLTVRNDWSSTLPKKNNSYIYPGVTASWVFSELGNDGHLGPINFGKVRASYGWTGRDAGVYSIYDTYSRSTVYNPLYSGMEYLTFPLNGISSWGLSTSMGNPELKPELTNEYEFGLELELFNGRIGFDGDYYNKFTKDLIYNSVRLDRSCGFAFTTDNIGDIRNEGVELMLYGYPVRDFHSFSWKISTNFSHNTNTVERLDIDEVNLAGFSGASIFAVEGKSIGQFKTVTSKQVEYEGNKYYVVNNNGIPKSTSNLDYVGKDVNEKFQLGLTNRFEYKGFALEGTLDLHYGGYMFMYTKRSIEFGGMGYMTTTNDRNAYVVPNSVIECASTVAGAFTLDGVTYYKENTIPVRKEMLNTIPSNGGLNNYNDMIIDRSYLKLRNVSFSYRLPQNFVSRLKLQEVKVSATAGNILLWKPKSNVYIDPEVSSYDNGIEAKFGECGANPANQVFTFGLSVKL